jgi:hypothetical protein
MIEASEYFSCDCSLCSLCGCCRDENTASTEDWGCSDENATPFIKNSIFYSGKCLCASGKNPDCAYRYAGNKVIAIEIKDQPEGNVKYDDLVGKIKNSYDCACGNGLILTAFILQISSKKNSSKTRHQLLLNCEEGLREHYLKIDKNGKLYSRNENLKNIRIKFDIIKCKDFDDRHFIKIAT